MNQLTVNNSNPSKLYVGDREGTSSFLSGQMVFPSVSGSVTFSGSALPIDTTLSADESSVNLSVVFSYDTRNSLAVVLQKQDSSNVMQDVEAVSVTDTRFSGWDSINATVDVSQNVPVDESLSVYQFKFTETVNGTDVTTLSSLMNVRREPELTLTLSPSGDQTVRPGEDITLTPTLTVTGIPSSSQSTPAFAWEVRKGENTNATDAIGDLNDPDYSVDSSTGALTITGNLSKAKKTFVCRANVFDMRIGTSGRLYAVGTTASVTCSESVGGYLPVSKALQHAWPSKTNGTKGELFGIPLPVSNSTRQKYSEYFDYNEVRLFGLMNYSGGYVRDVQMGEYRTNNQPRILLSYLSVGVKIPYNNTRSFRSDEDAVLFSVFTIARGQPNFPFVGNDVDQYQRLVRHSQYSDAGFLSAAIDPTKNSAAFGDGRATVTGALAGGGWGVIDLEDKFYTSNTTGRVVWRFYSQHQTTLKHEYQYPKVKKVLRAINPVKVYAFIEHNSIVGSCQIIASTGEGGDDRYRRYGTTEEVALIRPKFDYANTNANDLADNCQNSISNDFNWVLGVWNNTRLYNISQNASFPDMGTGMVQARMVKTNFDNSNDPVFYPSVDIPLDGLPASRLEWRVVQGYLSGDGSTAAVILSLNSRAALGGRVVFYSHDGNGVLTYKSSIEFPLAGHSPVDLSLSDNGQLALLTIQETHPNLGKGRTQLYSRSSASSWVWSEEESPDGVTVEERRLINALPPRSRETIEQGYELRGAISSNGNAIMTGQDCVLYEYDDQPDVFGRPQFYAVPVQKHTLFLKLKREEENNA